MVGSDLDMDGSWAAYRESRRLQRRHLLNQVEIAEKAALAHLEWAKDKRKEIDAEFPEFKDTAHE